MSLLSTEHEYKARLLREKCGPWNLDSELYVLYCMLSCKEPGLLLVSENLHDIELVPALLSITDQFDQTPLDLTLLRRTDIQQAYLLGVQSPARLTAIWPSLAVGHADPSNDVGRHAF